MGRAHEVRAASMAKTAAANPISMIKFEIITKNRLSHIR